MKLGRALLARSPRGSRACCTGRCRYLLQDPDGQIVETHSISAGLDYPGVGPEHAWLHDAGLAEYVSATDADALEGFQALARTEGILPALEPSHVIGWLLHRPLPEGARVLVCLSGRGDKDLDTVLAALGMHGLMGALEPALRARRERGRHGFVPYVTGGFPGVDADAAPRGRRGAAPTRSRWACRTPTR